MQCLSAPLKPGKGAGWPLGALCRRLAAAWSQSYFRLALTFLLAGAGRFSLSNRSRTMAKNLKVAPPFLSATRFANGGPLNHLGTQACE